ncbi:cytochrome b [Candidatus Halobeggiatoa sp. HSG11]|nr:cytochrome b [Candidatus Halobeggiatoa sp. HSG11]
MNIKNTQASYGIITILLHWVMAIIIIGLFFLGEYMVDLDYYDQWYHAAPWWHKSIGILVFALLLIRVGWKLSNPTLVPVANSQLWEVKIAKLVHIIFYILLFIICISGYFISTAKNVGIEIFGLFELPAVMELSENKADIVGEIHEISTHILVIVFLLHGIAALKHHFINKDNTLIRMLKP